MRAGVIAALAMMLCGPAPVSAQTAGTDALATRERDAVHLTDALRANGKSVEWLSFDGEGHGLAYSHNQRRYYGALLDFLQRHIGEPTAH